ncbi:hypothetical protein JQ543_28185 [Bradyrhizobium diazoefficiens]|nr:hypothetical protein [Bradyrhizobium diazoefficiens]MBR0851651.1 hypothetical protein [Bradyrhizobium diazoefficiens]
MRFSDLGGSKARGLTFCRAAAIIAPMIAPSEGKVYTDRAFFGGQPLDDNQLEALRVQLESFDRIEVASPELRAIVARNWPHLLPKLPPPEGDA